VVQEVAEKWRERLRGSRTEPDAMRTDDVGRLKIVGIRWKVAAVRDIAIGWSSPAVSGGSEIHVVLEDEDAFIRGCCVTDYSELRQENPLLAGRAPRRFIFHEDTFDELNAGIVSKADAPELAKHLRPPVRPRRQVDDPDPIEAWEYGHLVQLSLKSARNWFAELPMLNSVATAVFAF
jgi:hypothetical protein